MTAPLQERLQAAAVAPQPAAGGPDRAHSLEDRAGRCVVCGAWIITHWDDRNRFVSCAGAVVLARSSADERVS